MRPSRFQQAIEHKLSVANIRNEELEAEIKRLKDILRPFAEFSTLVDITRNETTITLQDFMKARQALKIEKV